MVLYRSISARPPNKLILNEIDVLHDVFVTSQVLIIKPAIVKIIDILRTTLHIRFT